MSCCTKIIDASKVITPCQCSGPGRCPVIGCTLNDYGYYLCRSSPGYLEHWKANGGAPCMEGAPGLVQSSRERVIGLGDAVAWIIRKATFGRVNPCAGCKSRMAWLNSKLTLWRRKA